MNAVEIPVETSFETIEDTQQFLSMLSDKIEDILKEARREHSLCATLNQERRAQAWQLVAYTTRKLSAHIGNSRKLMNDLAVVRDILTTGRDS